MGHDQFIKGGYLEYYMIKTRIIKEDDILEEYIEKYEKYSGFRLTKKFLEGTFLVRGFFDKTGELVGGHVVNKGPILRYILILPHSHRNILNNYKIRPEDVVEECCTWIRPDIPEKYRLKIFLYIFFDTILSNKRYFLVGTEIKKIKNVQERAFKKKLYEGPCIVGDKECYCWIFYGTRWALITGMFVELLRRYFNFYVISRLSQ